MARVSILLLVALVAFGVADARRPPPAKRSPPPPSPRPPPPPSPSPSPPPPPPSRYVFPHSCNPGNLPFSSPVGVDCTPYVLVNVPTGNDNTYKFRVTYRAVDPAVCKASTSCAAMPLNDVKFSINPACNGVFSGLKVTNATGTYGWSFQYARETYPTGSGVTGAGMTARVIFNKVPGGFLPSGAAADGLVFTFSQNTKVCTRAKTWSTASVQSGAIQYGYWDKSKKCCGQSVALSA
mmetsp:Transcript_907/g.2429  ORF Transcript_907/g.2429 Transcript_907/m.2429 type:complete len:237 (-) Transcript_907:472-1182(-)